MGIARAALSIAAPINLKRSRGREVTAAMSHSFNDCATHFTA